MAEPPHRAPGEPIRLSKGGAGGSGTVQGTTVSESSRSTNGEPARLSGVAPSQSAAEANASPRAHGEPVRPSFSFFLFLFFSFLPYPVAPFPRRLVVLSCNSASLRARSQVCRQA